MIRTLPDNPDLETDLALLKNTVLEAGGIALKYFRQSPEITIKTDGSPVSEADLAVDRFLKDRLLAERQHYGWLSEENREDQSRSEAERIWVVDPIDGTKSFLQGLGMWTISVALMQHGKPVLAAVYNPVTEEFFEAAAEGGARLNDRAISVSTTETFSECSFLVSRKVARQIGEESETEPKVAKWVNSIAYRLCLLSVGRVDAVLAKPGSSDWDIAAAHLILEEAGGKFTTLDAKTLLFNTISAKHHGLLATNNLLHDKLLKICTNIEF